MGANLSNTFSNLKKDLLKSDLENKHRAKFASAICQTLLFTDESHMSLVHTFNRTPSLL